jgi:hypothetical protein
MTVFMNKSSVTALQVLAVDSTTGLIRVGKSGASASNSNVFYAHQVYVTDTVAAGYGWPNTNSIVYGNQHFSLPSAAPRSQYLGAGGNPTAGG